MSSVPKPCDVPILVSRTAFLVHGLFSILHYIGYQSPRTYHHLSVISSYIPIFGYFKFLQIPIIHPHQGSHGSAKEFRDQLTGDALILGAADEFEKRISWLILDTLHFRWLYRTYRNITYKYHIYNIFIYIYNIYRKHIQI